MLFTGVARATSLPTTGNRLPASSPTSSSPVAEPTSSPPAAAANQSDDQQQQQRTDGGVDDRGDHARAEMQAELRKQPTADKGARDSYKEDAEHSESGALHDLAGQPSGNEADRQYDQQTFARHVHLCILQFHQTAGKNTAQSGKRRSQQRGRPSRNRRSA